LPIEAIGGPFTAIDRAPCSLRSRLGIIGGIGVSCGAPGKGAIDMWPTGRVGVALGVLAVCLGASGTSQARNVSVTHAIYYTNTRPVVTLVQVLNQGISAYARPGARITVQTQNFRAQNVDSTAYYRIVIAAENNVPYCNWVVRVEFSQSRGTFSCGNAASTGNCSIQPKQPFSGYNCEYDVGYSGPAN
jgi:hypothetical protein